MCFQSEITDHKYPGSVKLYSLSAITEGACQRSAAPETEFLCWNVTTLTVSDQGGQPFDICLTALFVKNGGSGYWLLKSNIIKSCCRDSAKNNSERDISTLDDKEMSVVTPLFSQRVR